jgi:hypothetical protein
MKKEGLCGGKPLVGFATQLREKARKLSQWNTALGHVISKRRQSNDRGTQIR